MWCVISVFQIPELEHTHTDTHTYASSLVAVQPEPVRVEQQPRRRHTNSKPGTPVHSYTNKQTHLLLLASRSDNQPKEGRQTKQTV